MGRFFKYLILNLAGVGLVGWMQFNLFDLDGVRTQLGSLGWRTAGTSSHK